MCVCVARKIDPCIINDIIGREASHLNFNKAAIILEGLAPISEGTCSQSKK